MSNQTNKPNLKAGDTVRYLLTGESRGQIIKHPLAVIRATYNDGFTGEPKADIEFQEEGYFGNRLNGVPVADLVAAK